MTANPFDVTGKVVLVTGAGRGIGRGIAEVLAEAGAEVAMNALTPRFVEAAARDITAKVGREVVPVIADVTRSESVQAAVDSVLERFGRIDVLVNALGDSIRTPLVTLPGKEDVPGVSDEELRSIIDINMTEALLCTRAVGAHMLGRRSGKVINVSSVTVQRGGGDMVIYTAAKTALTGFTRALAVEWAPYNVHVNAIAPGIFPDVVTSGQERFAQIVERAERTVPLGRHGEVREVGVLAQFLASSASDYLTGQTIVLDGGLAL